MKDKIIEEISTWKYLAEGLTQTHQEYVKSQILNKVKQLESELAALEAEIANLNKL